MTKTEIIKHNDHMRSLAKDLSNSKEVRSLAKFVRSHGEYRDGLTTNNNGAMVPTQVLTLAQDLSKGKFQLRPFLNQVTINTAKSNYPVMNPTAVAYTRDELEHYKDLDDGVTVVPVDAKSYGGKITLSDELLMDSNIPLTPMLAKEMATIQTNTENKVISDKLATLPATKVNSMDDVVNAITSKISSRFVKNVFIGQGAYGKLRTMKDAQGRYLINSNDNTICGVPIVVMPNSLGHSMDIYIGSLEDSLGFFDRGHETINYANNNLFAQSLAFVTRFDVEFTYKPAIARLTFDDATSTK